MTDLELASDPTTDPAILNRLSYGGDDLCRIVASNPNTSKQTLSFLFREFPEEVLDNPAVALYEITEPGLRFVSNENAEIAAKNTSSVRVLERLILHVSTNVRRVVLINVVCPESIREQFIDDDTTLVRRIIAKYTRSVDVLAKLSAVILRGLRDQSLSPERQRRFVMDANVLLENKLLPAHMAEEIEKAI